MNKRRLFIISFSIVSVGIIAVGIWYWYSEKVAEEKLKECIRKLNREGGYVIEEHLLADFNVDHIRKERDFTEFHQYASTSGIDHIYYDKGIHVLYFLQGDGIEAIVFNYKWGKM